MFGVCVCVRMCVCVVVCVGAYTYENTCARTHTHTNTHTQALRDLKHYVEKTRRQRIRRESGTDDSAYKILGTCARKRDLETESERASERVSERASARHRNMQTCKHANRARLLETQRQSGQRTTGGRISAQAASALCTGWLLNSLTASALLMAVPLSTATYACWSRT